MIFFLGRLLLLYIRVIIRLSACNAVCTGSYVVLSVTLIIMHSRPARRKVLAIAHAHTGLWTRGNGRRESVFVAEGYLQCWRQFPLQGRLSQALRGPTGAFLSQKVSDCCINKTNEIRQVHDHCVVLAGNSCCRL